MPVEKGTIGSLFGYRIHPNSGTKKFHSGLGIRAKYGNGLVTLYAHLSTFSVKKIEVICKGKVIGKIGITGNTNGPHLHFEIIDNKKKVNPVEYLF